MSTCELYKQFSVADAKCSNEPLSKLCLSMNCLSRCFSAIENLKQHKGPGVIDVFFFDEIAKLIIDKLI